MKWSSINKYRTTFLLMLLLVTSGLHAAPVINLAGTLTLTPTSNPAAGTESWDYTYSEPGWDTVMTGLIMKPVGNGPFPGIELNHGKGGDAVGFGKQKGEDWFIPAGYMIISVDLTHAGRVFCLDETNLCGGSQENVRRARRATEILSSQQLIDQVGAVVDRDNIFLYGNSLGALTTLEQAQDMGSRVRAVAMTAGGIVTRKNLAYMSPSGADGVADLGAPLIHMHGRKDNVIKDFEEDNLTNALNLYDKVHQIVWFPNAGHNIARQSLTENQVRDFILGWFDTYLNKTSPVITTVTPTEGVVGETVTIQGSRFGNDLNNNSGVSFNNTTAAAISWTDTQVDTSVPVGATSGGVELTVPVGPITDPEVEKPVGGGVRSNRVNFTVLP